MHSYGSLTYPMKEFKTNKVSFDVSDVAPSSSLPYEIVNVTNVNEHEIAYVIV